MSQLNEYANASGTHNKNPVQAGQAQPDVEHFQRSGKDFEVFNASSAPRDPGTGKIMMSNTDRLDVPTSSLRPEPCEHEQLRASAEDTLGGATSQDVNRGMGAPFQGQSSAELHNAAQQPHRKRQHEGAAQYGPQGGPAMLGHSDR